MHNFATAICLAFSLQAIIIHSDRKLMRWSVENTGGTLNNRNGFGGKNERALSLDSPKIQEIDEGFQPGLVQNKDPTAPQEISDLQHLDPAPNVDDKNLDPKIEEKLASEIQGVPDVQKEPLEQEVLPDQQLSKSPVAEVRKGPILAALEKNYLEKGAIPIAKLAPPLGSIFSKDNVEPNLAKQGRKNRLKRLGSFQESKKESDLQKTEKIATKVALDLNLQNRKPTQKPANDDPTSPKSSEIGDEEVLSLENFFNEDKQREIRNQQIHKMVDDALKRREKMEQMNPNFKKFQKRAADDSAIQTYELVLNKMNPELIRHQKIPMNVKKREEITSKLKEDIKPKFYEMLGIDLSEQGQITDTSQTKKSFNLLKTYQTQINNQYKNAGVAKNPMFKAIIRANRFTSQDAFDWTNDVNNRLVDPSVFVNAEAEKYKKIHEIKKNMLPPPKISLKNLKPPKLDLDITPQIINDLKNAGKPSATQAASEKKTKYSDYLNDINKQEFSPIQLLVFRDIKPLVNSVSRAINNEIFFQETTGNRITGINYSRVYVRNLRTLVPIDRVLIYFPFFVFFFMFLGIVFFGWKHPVFSLDCFCIADSFMINFYLFSWLHPNFANSSDNQLFLTVISVAFGIFLSNMASLYKTWRVMVLSASLSLTLQFVLDITMRTLIRVEFDTDQIIKQNLIIWILLIYPCKHFYDHIFAYGIFILSSANCCISFSYLFSTFSGRLSRRNPTVTFFMGVGISVVFCLLIWVGFNHHARQYQEHQKKARVFLETDDDSEFIPYGAVTFNAAN